MSIATGVGKQLRIKAESAWGTAAGASGAQLLRRVQSTLNLSKNTYESQEIRSDYQVADFRHGTRKVEGNINGEWSGGTYQMLIEALLRRAATAVSNITGLTVDVVGASAPYTITRASGDFFDDGMRPGMVAHFTAGADSGSLNVNFLVTAVDGADITAYPLNGKTLVAETAATGVTLAVKGKGTFVPSTGHLDKSFSIEEFHADIGLSRLYLGCKVNTCGIKLPATGMSTLEFAMMGKDMVVDTSAYFTSPTAETDSAVDVAVNGLVSLGGTPIAIATGCNIDVNGGLTSGEVIGSNTTPDLFQGRVRVTGQLTAYLEDESLLESFLNEDQLELAMVLNADSTAASETISTFIPRFKLGGATVDDGGEKGLIITAPFTALKKPVVDGYESTTIAIYDSLFV